MAISIFKMGQEGEDVCVWGRRERGGGMERDKEI